MNFKIFYEQKEYEIYLDLDGVIVDFEKGYEWLTDMSIEEAKLKLTDEKFWEPINDAGADFWSDLPWMSDGKILWNFVKDLNTTILSSPSDHESSKTGKKIWINRELNDEIEYIFDKEKEKYAKPTAILIDDRKKNIDKWRENEGIGILHTDSESTINKLKLIFGGNNE